MSTKSIWGWGGCRFVYGSQDVTFLTSFVKLGFEPDLLKKRLLNGDLYEKLKGYRAYFSINLLNYDAGDSDKVITLISIINNAQTANLPITIYPKYETPDLGQNWSGTFRLSSNIAFDDITKNVFAGQSAQLDFTGNSLLNSIPDNASDTGLRYRCYDSEDLTSFRVYDSTDATAKRKAQ